MVIDKSRNIMNNDTHINIYQDPTSEEFETIDIPLGIDDPIMAAKIHVQSGVIEELVPEAERNSRQSAKSFLERNPDIKTPIDIEWFREPFELIIDQSTQKKLIILQDGGMDPDKILKITNLYSTKDKAQGIDGCYGIGWKDVFLPQTDVAIVSCWKDKVFAVTVKMNSSDEPVRQAYRIDGEMHEISDVTEIFKDPKVRKKYNLDTKHTRDWTMFVALGRGVDWKKQDTFETLAPKNAEGKPDINWVFKKMQTRFYNHLPNQLTKLGKNCHNIRGNEDSGRITLKGIPHIYNEANTRSKGNVDDKGKPDEGFIIPKTVDGLDIVYGYTPTQKVRKSKDNTWWSSNRSWPWTGTISSLVFKAADGIEEMFDVRMRTGTHWKGVKGVERFLRELGVRGQYDSFFVFVILPYTNYRMSFPHRTSVHNKQDTFKAPLSLLSQTILEKIKKGLPDEWKTMAERKAVESKFEKDAIYLDGVTKFFSKQKEAGETKYELDKTKLGVHDYKKPDGIPNDPKDCKKCGKTPCVCEKDKDVIVIPPTPRKKFKPYGNTFGVFGIDINKIARNPKAKHPKIVVCKSKLDANDQGLIDNFGKADEKQYAHSYSKAINTIFCNPFSNTHERCARRILKANKGYFNDKDDLDSIRGHVANELGKRLVAPILVAKNEMIHEIDSLFTRTHMSIMAESFLYDNFRKIETVCKEGVKQIPITDIDKDVVTNQSDARDTGKSVEEIEEDNKTLRDKSVTPSEAKKKLGLK